MGVTIHFTGKLKGPEHLKALERIGLRWAKKWNCELSEIDFDSFPLFRETNGVVDEYEGPVTGFFLQPHKESESVRILLDKDLFMEHFCKTQFAPPENHVQVCTFLRDIEPLFDGFKVVDEGGYWDTGDRVELKRKLDFLSRMIDKVQEMFEKAGKTVTRSEGEPPASGMN